MRHISQPNVVVVVNINEVNMSYMQDAGIYRRAETRYIEESGDWIEYTLVATRMTSSQYMISSTLQKATTQAKERLEK